MLDITDLRWTTPEGVARDLVAIIDGGPSWPTGSHAARLLYHLATEDVAPDLLRIARSRDSPYWNRIYALRGLQRAGAVVPLEALRELLDEQPLAPDEGPRSCSIAPSTTPPILDLMLIVRTPEQVELARAWLSRAAPALRRRLLTDAVCLMDPPVPEIVTWLLDRWLERVAAWGPEKQDADAACSIDHWHPEAEQVAKAYWAMPSRDKAELVRAARYRPHLRFLLDAAARDEGARLLCLPLPDLLAVLGFHELRSALKAAVHAKSVRLFEPPRPHRDEDLDMRFRGAIDVLREWSEGAAVARCLLQGARLHPEVRAQVALALFEHDREAAFGAEAAHPEGAPALRAMVKEMKRKPEAGDRPLLLRALRYLDEEVRYRAIDALEASGEDDEAYRDVLRALARHAAPLLRIRARGALARRGEAGHCEALAEAVSAEPDVRARAEAIRCLCSLDGAEQHADLFERALLTDRVRSGKWSYHVPAAEQAAIALGAIGGERVLTPLLRGYFAEISSNPLSDVIEPIFTMLGADDAPSSQGERLDRIRKTDMGWATSWDPY